MEAPAGPPSRPSLIPGPEETAFLPPIPEGDTPAPAGFGSETRKKQSVKRHRGDSPLSGSERARRTVRGAGEVLITFGVIVMLYALYEIYGVSAEINAAQDDMATDLDVLWEQSDEDGGTPIPELGDAFARMWAPDIRERSWILVEGTELSDIEFAPGRFMEGAYPGEQGNFTLAGHNVPAIFQKIRDLRPGDKVVIETKNNFYVYEVQYSEIVPDTQVDVTAPVPRNPGTPPGPDDYWLTLFTCNPLWDNYERYVVYHKLIATYERDPAGELPDEAINPRA
jgi:sortase A